MKQTLQALSLGETLSSAEAKEIMLNITSGSFSSEEVAAFLMALNMRAWVVDELVGFREAMLERAIAVDLGSNTIDIVGTGGDGKNTFNISTCTAIVVAGAGYKVAKHGSYSVSSVSGSANVLLEMGLKFTNSQSVLKECLAETNFCFLHAPLFHPAMKYVVPIRKALRIRTVFNIMGPLINPAQTGYGVYGVFSEELAPIYQQVFNQTGIEYRIVHSLDGYDEISLTDNTLILDSKEETILPPQSFGYERIKPKAIFGGSTKEKAAAIFKSVLENTAPVEQKEVVLANAALVIQTKESHLGLEECKEIARQSIESGAAMKTLTQLVEITKQME